MRALTLCLAVTSGLLLAPDDGAAARGLKALQGKWVATSVRHGAAEAPKDELKGEAVVLTVVGSSFTFKMPERLHVGKMKVDPSANPMTMDMLIDTPEGETVQARWIYEMKGETLRLAGHPDRRPGDFRARGAVVVTLRRSLR